MKYRTKIRRGVFGNERVIVQRRFGFLWFEVWCLCRYPRDEAENLAKAYVESAITRDKQ